MEQRVKSPICGRSITNRRIKLLTPEKRLGSFEGIKEVVVRMPLVVKAILVVVLFNVVILIGGF